MPVCGWMMAGGCVFVLLLEDQIIWTEWKGEWKWVREGQTLVPCFSLTSNVIRTLNEGYGLDSNPQLSLIPLRHLSATVSLLLRSFPRLQTGIVLFPLASVLFLNIFFYVLDTVMAAVVHSCHHVKSNDVTSMGMWTSAPVAVLHLFYLMGCNEWSSARHFFCISPIGRESFHRVINHKASWVIRQTRGWSRQWNVINKSIHL